MVPPTTVGITVTAATQGRVMGIGLISTAPTPAAGEVPVTIWGIAVGNCNGRRCPSAFVHLRACDARTTSAETEPMASADAHMPFNEQPLCRCSGRMTLANAARRPDGAEVRTYVCAECEHQLHLTCWVQGQ